MVWRVGNAECTRYTGRLPRGIKDATTFPPNDASNPVLTHAGLCRCPASHERANKFNQGRSNPRGGCRRSSCYPRHGTFDPATASSFEVCGEAENGAEAIEEVKRVRPDVVVLNVTMPLVNGFEAAREIKKHVPETAIVILSSHADKHFVDEAKKIGVRAYVPKSKMGQALVEALEAAVKGDDFIVLE